MRKNVVVIGGGTGTMPVLQGLKSFSKISLSVIVSMTDDGGSNRVILDEFGLLPMSDIRKSIIALSSIENGILRDMFTYRFYKGKGFSGHTLGNIIMMALCDITGSQKKAIDTLCKLFMVKDNIVPVTFKKAKLVARYESGRIVVGEHKIDEPKKDCREKIKNLYTIPKVRANPLVYKTIKNADIIVIGPGDLYTSILASIVIGNVSKFIKQSKAKIIYITNLMTKNGQTRGFSTTDLVEEVRKYIGKYPDFVVINNKTIPRKIQNKYFKLEGEKPIIDDLADSSYYKIIRRDIINTREVKKVRGDTLKRSIVRHDAIKLGSVLQELITEEVILL